MKEVTIVEVSQNSNEGRIMLVSKYGIDWLSFKLDVFNQLIEKLLDFTRVLNIAELLGKKIYFLYDEVASKIGFCSVTENIFFFIDQNEELTNQLSF